MQRQCIWDASLNYLLMLQHFSAVIFVHNLQFRQINDCGLLEPCKTLKILRQFHLKALIPKSPKIECIESWKPDASTSDTIY